MATTNQPAYLDIVQRKQAEQASRIPKEWRLKSLPDKGVLDVRHIPKQSGILSARELEITETYDAVELADKIRRRDYSCYEVTLAFCKRAAIAQQLVSGTCGDLANWSQLFITELPRGDTGNVARLGGKSVEPLHPSINNLKLVLPWPPEKPSAHKQSHFMN